jgi:hypothetical protein
MALLKLIKALVKDYYAQKRLYKQIIKAPFNTAYLQALINSSQSGVVLEVMQPDGNIIRITKQDRDHQRQSDLSYYALPELAELKRKYDREY